MFEQSRREFTPIAWQWFVCKPREGAVSTTRTSHAAVPQHANLTEIRLRPRLGSQLCHRQLICSDDPSAKSPRIHSDFTNNGVAIKNEEYHDP